MLGHPPFYFSLVRKYISLFGTIFNDIHIVRTDAAGDAVKFIKVPIFYAPKERVLARVDQDMKLNRPQAVTLPIMSFENNGLVYDEERKLPTTGRSVKLGANTATNKYQYNPVPYNFNFTLYIYSKNAEDCTKIVEQILPFFTPDWTPTIELVQEMGINMDTPIIMEGIDIDDNYTEGFAERRAIVWAIRFVVKGFLFGPTQQNPIIKFANVTFYVPTVDDIQDAVGNTDPIDRVTVQPGLTANGEPTSNAELTVPYTEIEATDDFGYVVTIAGILPQSNT